MATFADKVAEELARARSLHGRMHNAHEAYAVILEELDEFWEEVRRKQSERSPRRLLAELIQIGAMAQRTAEDLGLIESVATTWPSGGGVCDAARDALRELHPGADF